MPVRIIFAGTPEAAVPTLRALLASDHEVAAVLTRPPARAGRGREPRPSPVAVVAQDAGVALIEASSLREEATRHAVSEVGADLGVVVAYGALVPREVLDMPRLGWVNLHFSDLPRWRGAAPVQWAILSGDAMTASCVFRLEEGLDTGPVLSRLPVRIGHETAGELLGRMSRLGAAQVVDVVDALGAGTAVAVAQDEGPGGSLVTYARRLGHEDGCVDFTEGAAAVDRRIRGTTPNPGAWTVLPDGRRLKLGAVEVTATPSPAPGLVRVGRRSVEVGCADTCVLLGRVAPAGRGWMDAPSWARGARLGEGARLGVPAGTGSPDDGGALR